MKATTIGAAVLVITIALTALAIATAQPAHADPDCNAPPTNLSAALNGDNSAVVITWDAPRTAPPIPTRCTAGSWTRRTGYAR